VVGRHSLRLHRRKGRGQTIARCRGRCAHDVQTCVTRYMPKAPRWAWAFLFASLSVRCVTVEKGDGDLLLQESMAVFVTSVVLMSLTLYTGSDPRNESDL